MFCKSKGLTFHRFSEQEDFESNVVLMDRIGELVNLYAISDIVILGGSFVEGIGGHNPLEPAHFGVKLLSGKFIFNQETLFPLIENVLFCRADETETAIMKAKPVKMNISADFAYVMRELENVV